HAHRGTGGGDHGPHQRAGLRVARRPDHARHGARCAAAVRTDVGRFRPPPNGGRCESGALVSRVLNVSPYGRTAVWPYATAIDFTAYGPYGHTAIRGGRSHGSH